MSSRSRLRHWYGKHRETVISLLIILAILAGLVIIWGGGTKLQSENRGMGSSSSSVSLIPPIVDMTPSATVPTKHHDDLAAERTLWEQASVNARRATMRASRGVVGGRRSTVHRGEAIRGTGSGDLPPDSVKMCESRGDYTAQNKRSSASGGWQITDGTWDGYGGYSHAADAPKDVQDERARQIWRNGAGSGAWASCL